MKGSGEHNDFGHLYERLIQGDPVADLLESVEDPDWRLFLRTHRSLLENSPRPAATLLSRAQAYGAESPISRQAEAWWTHQPQDQAWLRLAQRPQRPDPAPPPILAHSGGAVEALALAGRRIYSGGRDDTLRVWDLETWECLRVLPQKGDVLGLAAGELLAVWVDPFSGKSSLRILELEQLNCLYEHEPEDKVLAMQRVGNSLIYAGWDKYLWQWSWTQAEPRRLGAGHTDHVTCLAASGPLIFSGSADKTVRVWDLNGGECVGQWPGHSARISDLCVTPRGLLSSSYDGTIRLWNLDRGECLQSWPVYAGAARLTLLPDGRRVAVASEDQVFLLDLESGQQQMVEEGVGSTSSLAVTADGRHLLCGSTGEVRVWDLEQPDRYEMPRQRLVRLGRPACAPRSLAFTPNGQRVLSVAHDAMLRVWDFARGECIATLSGHRCEITSVLVSPDGAVAVTGGGSQDYRAHSWDLASLTSLQIYEGHRHRVFVTSVNNQHALSVSWDGSSHLWDLRSGECVWRGDSSSQAFLTPEGLREIRGGHEIYDPLSHQLLRRLAGPAGKIIPGLCSYDGEMVWDLESGEPLGEVRVKDPRDALLTRAGPLLACRGRARQLWVYHLPRKEWLVAWPTEAEIEALAVHPSGRLAVGLSDGQIHFLELVLPEGFSSSCPR